MPKCLVCDTDRPENDCHIIVLTPQERAQIPNPLDQYIYCKPCWNVLSDPLAGPALMSGIAQHHLQRLGVSNAEELALRFRKTLTKKASTRRS